MDEKIKQIDKTVLEKGLSHGLSVKDVGFCQDILKGKTQTEAYKNNIAKNPDSMSRNSIDATASDKLRNPKIQDTIKDVLISNKITKDSVIKQHQAILTQAIEVKQLSTAEKCNVKFMQLLGMEEIQPINQTNIQVNIEKMSDEDINEKLKDIITL